MNQNETAELSDMFILQGIPAHIRSDNSQESMTKAHGDSMVPVGFKTAYIMPGSPWWMNGFADHHNTHYICSTYLTLITSAGDILICCYPFRWPVE
jgi:hypothetical protein